MTIYFFAKCKIVLIFFATILYLERMSGIQHIFKTLLWKLTSDDKIKDYKYKLGFIMFSQKCRSRLYKSNFLLRKHSYSCKTSFSLSFYTWRLPNRKSASSPKARLTVRRASSIQKRDSLSKVASPDEKQLRMQIASTSYIESVRLKSRRWGRFQVYWPPSAGPALLIELPSHCVGCVVPHQATWWVLQFPKFAIQNCNF